MQWCDSSIVIDGHFCGSSCDHPRGRTPGSFPRICNRVWREKSRRPEWCSLEGFRASSCFLWLRRTASGPSVLLLLNTRCVLTKPSERVERRYFSQLVSRISLLARLGRAFSPTGFSVVCLHLQKGKPQVCRVAVALCLSTHKIELADILRCGKAVR